MTDRYSVLIADGVLAGVLLGFVFFAQEGSPPVFQDTFLEVSPAAAVSLDRKIALIRQAESDLERYESAASTVEITEIEMESFILYEMEDNIPAKVESIDVGIGVETISALTELTFSVEETGEFMLDYLMGGTHSLLVEGRLEAKQGSGKFALLGVRLDGFPVPIGLVEMLVGQFVTPRYPMVDLSKPFDVPWGIEEVVLSPGLATITY